MKQRNKTVLRIGLLIFFTLIAVIIMGSSGPHLTCHKILSGGLAQWMLETKNGAEFPNVDGNSSRSLALIHPYFQDHTNELRDYMYVPGLRSDDPENLILIYVRKPSRRMWHGDTRFTGPKLWVILNPLLSDGDSAQTRGELSEGVTLAEFKKRLRATLDYLKRNDRPHWQATEREHLQFINSILE